MANVTFVDCNGGFMARGKINSKLMPDALHPNPAGTASAPRYLTGNCTREGLDTYSGMCSTVLDTAGLDVLAKCYKAVLSDLGLLKRTGRLRVRLKQ